MNEQEIQKRLYGRYHRDSASSVKNLTNSTAPHQVKVVAPEESISFSDWLRAHVRAPLRQFLQRIPWKFAAIVTITLIAMIVGLQMISFWFGQLKAASDAREISPRADVQVKKETAEVRVETKRPAASLASPASMVAISQETPKKKYYAVQVCTYQREQDALQLIEELKNSRFPAFYVRLPSRQQKTLYYVVFLGKEETYQAASAKLKEFRKTQIFQRFSDSFIRSI
ncbi:MAG: SPOR domain-containing protein [Candidatus Omnitrophica bacterium]|nr:SPOR domain-containing protein [Candidatus Omnitrophota bacterium]